MLLTITTTHRPATDLGFLLHKNPGRAHEFALSFGKAHVIYPEASEERCTAALLLEVDPVGLVRNRRGPGGEGGALEQYVNDRPYAASSFLSVAIAEVFGTALSGRSKQTPQLVEAKLPLVAKLHALPSRGGEVFLRRIFEPLGYTVEAKRLPLDPLFPEWGESRYFAVTLSGVLRLKDLLDHLYVLVPVLDDDKHYWVGDDELEKLLRHGGDWLRAHPEREPIAERYLVHKRRLANRALERLLEQDEDPDACEEAHSREEEAVEKKVSLHEERLNVVLSVLQESGASRVIDLGCGEGKLLSLLLKDKRFTEITGLDVASNALEIAARRLKLDQISASKRERLRLLHGSLLYRDKRIAGYDAAALVEVIEHLDPARLEALERVVFEAARPRTVVVTTPNAEYNIRFEGLPVGAMRHKDHRFEWTRAEFARWAERVASRFGYNVRVTPVGPVDEVVGAPTQMGIFTKADSHERQPQNS